MREQTPICPDEAGPSQGFGIRVSCFEFESRRCSRDTYPESYITKHTDLRSFEKRAQTCAIRDEAGPSLFTSVDNTDDCNQTWGDNISVLSDFISLPADNNTDNSGPKKVGPPRGFGFRVSCFEFRGTPLEEVPPMQMMPEGHLHRVIYHQVHWNPL